MSKRMKPLKTVIALSVMLLLGAFGLHSALSGQLEPDSAPGPTMYTLEDIYNFRVWKMMGKTFVNHPGNTRFAVYDPGTAADPADDLVLDKETGLIWARQPGELAYFYDSMLVCRNDTELGGRKGWRLPSVEELSSLLDMSQDSPALPTGHPFVGVQNNWYWTDPPPAIAAYAWMDSEDYNYVVNMGDGTVNYYIDAEGADDAYVWCVWGGSGNGL